MVKKYWWPWIDVNEYGPHTSTWIKSKYFLDLDELRGKGSFFALQNDKYHKWKIYYI